MVLHSAKESKLVEIALIFHTAQLFCVFNFGSVFTVAMYNIWMSQVILPPKG